MAEYRIRQDESGALIVAHYVDGDPQPTPTERTFTDGHKRPEAWINAFGRAAKHAAVTGVPCTVQTDMGSRFRITAERIDHAD